MKKSSFLLTLLIGIFAAVSAVQVHAAALTNVVHSASDYAISTSPSTHTISFVTATSDTVGKVKMAFSDGFTFSGISLDSFTGIATGTISYTGDTIIYTVTTPETLSSGTTCTIRIAGIGNASVCADTYAVSVSTVTAEDTLIDGPDSSNTFALTGNTIKFVTFSQVLAAGDTSLPIYIIACDPSGNTDVIFDSSVLLSTTSNSGSFSISDVAWQDTTTIYLSAGTAVFYYRDTAIGEFEISASYTEYTTGTQSVKIVEFVSNFVSPYGAEVIVSSLTNITTVTIPAGTFGSTSCIIVTENPTSNAITEANNGVSGDPSKKLITELLNTVREISAFAVCDSYVDLEQPLDPEAGKYVQVTIPYNPTITGSLEDGLRFCRLDEVTNGWMLVAGTSNIDKTKKEISMNLSSLSFYRIISFAVSSDLSEILVFPNPFEMSRARDGTLKFTRLPTQVQIKIYNLAGELVKTLEKNNTVNRIEWNGQNEKGEKVASGLYFYIITSTQDARVITGKFAIIGN